MAPMAPDDPARRRGVFRARIVANRPLCPDHYLLRMEAPGFPPSRPGQFVNLRCGPGGDLPGASPVDWPEGAFPPLDQDELAGRRPLLRRPFSLAGRRDAPDGAARLEVLHRVVGVGTAWLAQQPAGAELDLMGPLGRGFEDVAARPRAALVGGGTGIGPLLYLAEALAGAGVEAVAFAGARTARLLPLTVADDEPPSQAGWPTRCTAEFSARGTPAVIATDDGSLGRCGLVHEALARWMDDDGGDPSDLAVFACGPEAMMRAVAHLCRDRGCLCRLALERHMACGVGTCQGCAVKVRADNDRGWAFKLACRDGPVFDAQELIW